VIFQQSRFLGGIRLWGGDQRYHSRLKKGATCDSTDNVCLRVGRADHCNFARDRQGEPTTALDCSRTCRNRCNASLAYWHVDTVTRLQELHWSSYTDNAPVYQDLVQAVPRDRKKTWNCGVLINARLSTGKSRPQSASRESYARRNRKFDDVVPASIERARFREAVLFGRGDYSTTCRKATPRRDGDAQGYIPPELSSTVSQLLAHLLGMYGPPQCCKRKMNNGSWSAPMYSASSGVIDSGPHSGAHVPAVVLTNCSDRELACVAVALRCVHLG
jgi:hypothetical protein